MKLGAELLWQIARMLDGRQQILDFIIPSNYRVMSRVCHSRGSLLMRRGVRIAPEFGIGGAMRRLDHRLFNFLAL